MPFMIKFSRTCCSLNAIRPYEREICCQSAVNRHLIFIKLTAGQKQYLLNHFVYVQFVPFGRSLLYECANPRQNGAGACAIRNDFLECPAQHVWFKIVIREQSKTGISVIGYRGQRLIHLVGNGRRHFAQICELGHLGKLRSGLVKRLFGLPTLGYILDNGDVLQLTILVAGRMSDRMHDT